jgi:hypothetical protein
MRIKCRGKVGCHNACRHYCFVLKKGFVADGEEEHVTRDSFSPQTTTMADDATETAVRRGNSRAGSMISVSPGQPTEQLQVQEAGEEQVQYPTGPQLWLNAGAMMLVCFLHGLDLTIVAPTVPSLTNEFKTVADIGWYSAVYGLVLSATNFFFGKMYTQFDLKKVYIASVATFELGSVMCTFAPSSTAFIMGRAVAGMLLPDVHFHKTTLADVCWCHQVLVHAVRVR